MIDMNKIQELCETITKDQHFELNQDGRNCELNLINSIAHYVEKRRYINIDLGRGQGRYMVDKIDGHIYGIKAYGQINRIRHFGTLDTIHNYFWGRFHATKKRKAA